jgi:WD40 repeat protein
VGLLSPYHQTSHIYCLSVCDLFLFLQTVKVWDVRAGRLRHNLQDHFGTVTVLTALSGGDVASGGRDGCVKVWNTSEGTKIRSIKAHRSAVTVLNSPLGFSRSHGIHMGIVHVGGTDVGADLDRQFMSAGADGGVQLWNATKARPLRMFGNNNAVTAANWFSPTGLLSGVSNGTLRLWDFSGGREASTTVRTFVGHTEPISCLAKGPHEGSFISSSKDGSIRFWNSAL